MATLLALLCFAAFVLMLFGLISPGLVLRWGPVEKRTRKKVLLFYGLLCISSLALFSIFDEGTGTTGSINSQLEQGTTNSPTTSESNQNSSFLNKVESITESQVGQLTEGMSYNDFVIMMGGEGDLVYDRQGVKTYIFILEGSDGVEVRISFDNGKMLMYTRSDEFE